MNIDTTLGIFGIDLSKWQSDPINKIMVDFNKMKNSGATFVVPKIGQRNYYDYDADYNWRASRDAGLLRGSYWFLDYRETAEEQAQKHFTFFESRKDFGEGVHFVDYEVGSGGNWNDVYRYIVEFQKLSGLPNHKIGVYTGYFYWNEHSPYSVEQRKWFSKYPLWLAWYILNAPTTSVQDVFDYYEKNASGVMVPNAWSEDEVLFWQAGTPVIGKQLGAQSLELDFNLFNGNANKFELHFGTSVPEPEPPPTNDNGGTSLMYNLIVLADYLNGRSSPGGTLNFPAGAAYQTGFRKDDVLESDLTQKDSYGTDWYRIVKCIRNNVDITSTLPSPVWASAGATYGYMRLYTPAPTPEPTPASELYLSLTPGGVQYKYVLSKE